MPMVGAQVRSVSPYARECARLPQVGLLIGLQLQYKPSVIPTFQFSFPSWHDWEALRLIP